jgi:protein-disulfide isomerase
VIEYSDFECPFCVRFQQLTYPMIVRDYVETGKIRFAYRHLPLEQKHQYAMKAAEAAECSARQTRFWPMHDQLFAQPTALDPDSLVAKARRIGLNTVRFNECMKGEAVDLVRRDISHARSLLVGSTPTFFFGTIERDGRLKVSRRESGAIPKETFAAILNDLLRLTTGSP